MQLRKSSIFSFICLFAWIVLGVLDISTPIRVLVRFFVLVLLIVKKGRKINGVIWLFVAYMILSTVSVALYDYSMENVLRTFSALSIPIGMMLLFYDADDKELLTKQCFVIYSIILFIDIVVLITTPNGLEQNVHGDAIYFSGGKFSAVYIYLAWLMFLYQVKQDLSRVWTVILTVAGVVYSYNLDCMTGAVAIFSFGIIMLIPKNLSTGKKALIWPVGITVLTYLIVFLQVQTAVPWISNFITVTLNSSLDLTGRTNIYSAIPKIMEGHWLLGWGYTSNRVVDITMLANMQNGLMQLIYYSGLVGLLPYLIIIILAIKNMISLEDKQKSALFMATFAAFLVVAIVEIPFNTIAFYFLIGCVFMEKRNEEMLEYEEEYMNTNVMPEEF